MITKRAGWNVAGVGSLVSLVLIMGSSPGISAPGKRCTIHRNAYISSRGFAGIG